MKKTLLLLVAMLAMFVTANATDLTIVPNGDGVAWTAAGTGFTTTVNGFTITTEKGTSTTALVTPSDLIKAYKNSTITIDGGTATITAIVFTCSGSNYCKDVTASEGTATTDADNLKIKWSGSTSKVTFTSGGGQNRISKIEITYTADANSTTAPSLSAGGVFTAKPHEVTITNNEEGATVYYTTDGTEPTTESTSFTEASKTLQINETTTVKAFAAAQGKSSSSVITATYTYEESIANTLETAYTTAQAIALIDKGSSQLTSTKVYVKGIISKIDNFNDNYGSIQYWLDDNAFEIYGGLNNNGEKFTAATDIRVGSEVVCLGLIKKYGTTYEMDKNNWLVSYVAPAKPEPTLTAEVKTELYKGESDVYGLTFTGDAQEYKYESSDTTVATIEWNSEDLEFTVTALKMGKTTISISTDETDKYMPKTFSYTLVVNEKWEAAAVPFYFDGGKDDATPSKGIMATGIGADYKASPLMKFDGTGDNLIIKIADAAKYLAYTIKGNSYTNTSTFDVLESADGETYETLKTYKDEFDETNENIALKAETRYIKFVYTKKGAGNVALGAIEISNAAAMADFENETLEAESVKQYATADGTVAFNAGSRYTFQNQCAYGGTYWAGYTLTNKTTTTANADYTNSYESACGGAKSGKNYLVWYDTTWTGGDSIAAPVAREISGFYVSNTTYTENVIINGNYAARALDQEGDTLTLKITGYDATGKATKTINYNLAQVKDGKLYYVKAWRWVDLTGLGKVTCVKFSIDSSDKGQWGVNTPLYFCMDDFGGVAPAEDAALECIDTTTAIQGIDADSTADGKFLQNGRIIIKKAGRTYNTAGQMLK